MYGVITHKLGQVMKQIMKERFEFFLDNYQKKEQIMKGGSDFNFENVELLDYHLHKINSKRGKSYIKSPGWLENKRATINPKHDDDNCFQYANGCIKSSKH